MKYVFCLLFAVVVTGCDYKEDAEQSAKEFAEELGLEIDRISCADQDSDNDGYVSCTFKLRSGEIKQFECAHRMFESGCREPKFGFGGGGD
jgi:hypothetical protein